MHKISRQALRDINLLYHRFLFQFCPDQARRILKEIEECIDLISCFPETGKDCGHLMKGLRQYSYRGCVFYYRLQKNHVFIIRMLDGETEHGLSDDILTIK
ncbi:MAG: type II toxin-antitoxin system RelE/ParE family toxin [Pantoea sp.]|uniref:type II toxin-antitoxin system RelE/ParE family toxin n=1 Tax=Pantoea sp. TaxID=69393 RepID=UPI0039E2DA57